MRAWIRSALISSGTDIWSSSRRRSCGLGLEDLFAEVVGDEPIRATELGHEVVRVVVHPERHARQLQSGCPALGPVDKGGHAVRR